MRKTFASSLHSEMKNNKDIYLLTGDLGYRVWDDIKKDFPDRFINVGSSEQLMIGMGTGLALDGKIPVVYSITPFLLYRPFEVIRNYLHYEKIPVKLVASGRDKDYEKLGYTHWATEDQQIMNILQNIQTFRPNEKEEVKLLMDNFLYSKSPSYLNLKK